jgi:hypothetical protein
MITLITRVALAAGGLVAGWFVARDAPNFNVIQGIAAMLIIAAVVAAAALWPALRRRGRE